MQNSTLSRMDMANIVEVRKGFSTDTFNEVIKSQAWRTSGVIKFHCIRKINYFYMKEIQAPPQKKKKLIRVLKV